MAKSQTVYNMQDTTIIECEGILKDSDAQFGGRYDPNEDYTFKICPGKNAQIVFNFNFLSLEPDYDSIMFFDGPDILSPFIVGYTGNFVGTPPPVIANSGCLTVRFFSDGTLQQNGWDAFWTTAAPAIVPPELTTITTNPPQCDSTSFLIEFDTLVHCDSILTSRFNITGTNVPSIVNVNPIACNSDSTRFARVFLSDPFRYNCQYVINFNLNILDICDSLFSYIITDTFDFNTCNIQANTSPNDTICIGECSSVSLNLFSGCQSNTFVWTEGLPATQGPHNVCPTSTTTYYVTVTETNTGIQLLDSVTITVLDTVNPDIKIEISTTNPPQCDSNNFVVIFNPPLVCNLLDSGIFILNSNNGNQYNILNTTPLNCNGNNIDSVRIELSSPFTSNCEYYLDYNLNFNDQCNDNINILISDTFSLANCNLTTSLNYPDTICLGNCGNVTATMNGCSTYNYAWSNGLPNSAGPHSICPTNDTTFYLTVTENLSGLTYTDTITIKALPQGVILDMDINSTPTCNADSIILDFFPSISCNALQVNNFSLLGGTTLTPIIDSISPVNCLSGNTNRAIVYLNGPYQYNCDYILSFNIDTTDPCGVLYDLTFIDTFRVSDCEINYDLTYADTICGGTCTNINITPISTCFDLHYTWSNGLPDSPGPHIICPNQDTTFTVTIIEDSTGVIALDTISISVDNSLSEYIMTIDSSESLPTCDSIKLYVKFSQKIICDSIYTRAFSFIGGVNFPIIDTAYGTGCNGPNDSTETAVIILANPFTGNCSYNLTFNLNSSFCSSTLITSFDILDCPFVASLNYNDTVCYNSCTSVLMTTNSCLPVIYNWSNGLISSGGPHNICPIGDSTFYVTATEQYSLKTFTDTVNIKYINTRINPVVDFCLNSQPLNLTAGMPGGSWAGIGITNSTLGTFDPSNAGIGSHKITYDLLGCRDSIFINVYVTDAGPSDTICNSGDPYLLTGYSPIGGIWTGPNVTPGGIFTSSNYGSYKLYYTANGCIDSTIIFVDTLKLFYNIDTVCNYTTAYNIPFSPYGGTWSGPGITNPTQGTFDPTLANSGNNTLYYNFSGCIDSIDIFNVDIEAGNDTVACPLQSAFNLPSGTPIGGVWSGNGILNQNTGLYDPAISGNNQTDTLIYSLYGCSDTLLVQVIQTDIQIDTIHFCLNEDSIQLIGSASNPISPPGGVWTGNGVIFNGTDYYFRPDIAGIGPHNLIYENNSCSDSIVMVVYPNQLSYIDSTICNTHNSFKIDSINNITGAKWVGTGIVDEKTGEFDPSLAIIGPNVIRYVNSAFNCEQTITINVYQFIKADITFPDTICFINYDSIIPIIPSGGIWGGSGLYNRVNGSFNPATAGPLTNNEIIYKFGVGQCLTIDTAYVYVRDSLSLSLTASLDKICPNYNTTLFAIGSGGHTNQGYTYNWSHTSSVTSVQTVTPLITTTYSVELTDGCSAPITLTKLIEVYPQAISTLTTSPTRCFGEIGFATFDRNQPNHGYTWINPNITADTAFLFTDDSVVARISYGSGCILDTTIIIPGYGYISADFDLKPDLAPGICLPHNNTTIDLIDQSIGGITGNWDLGEANFAYSSGTNVNYTYNSQGFYTITLTIKNAGPCYDTATDEVCVIEEPIFVPDIFSPNGDGSNDFAFARSQQVDKIEFYIFDRWGKEVFRTRDIEIGWDGTFNSKEANAGVYVYYVNALLKNGELIELKGDITLVR